MQGASTSSKAINDTAVSSQKQRTHTSADSGWGEGESSHDSHASADGSSTQASTAESSSKLSDTTASDKPATLEGGTPPVAPASKQPSGPPAVNIWKVRGEEMAKKQAEQAKMRAEQDAQRAALAPKQDEVKQPAQSASAQASTSAEQTAPTGKKSKTQKKRDRDAAALTAAAAGTEGTSSAPNTISPKASEIDAKTEVGANGPASERLRSTQATSTPGTAQSRPLPVGDNESREAESLRQNSIERGNQERDREESTSRGVSSAAGSPSAEKKKRTSEYGHLAYQRLIFASLQPRGRRYSLKSHSTHLY